MPVKGVKKTLRGLRTFRKNAIKSLLEVNKENALDLLNRANGLVPEKTGDLKLSGKLEVQKNGSSVAVRFTEDYAFLQHEGINPETGLPYRPGPGTRAKPGTADGTPGSKYLERPFNRNKRKYVKRARKAVEDAIGRI